MSRISNKSVRLLSSNAVAGIAEYATWTALYAALITSGSTGDLALLANGGGNIGVFLNDGTNARLLGPLDFSACDGTEFSLGVVGSGADLIYTRTSGDAPTWGSQGASGGLIITDGLVNLKFLGEYSAVGSLNITASIVPTITTTATSQILGACGFSRKANTESMFGAIGYTSSLWKSGYKYGATTGNLSAFGSTYTKDTVATGVEFIANFQTLCGRGAGTVEFSFISGAYAGDNAGSGDANYANGNIAITSAPIADWIPCLATYEHAGDISGRYKTVTFSEHIRVGGA